MAFHFEQDFNEGSQSHRLQFVVLPYRPQNFGACGCLSSPKKMSPSHTVCRLLYGPQNFGASGCSDGKPQEGESESHSLSFYCNNIDMPHNFGASGCLSSPKKMSPSPTRTWGLCPWDPIGGVKQSREPSNTEPVVMRWAIAAYHRFGSCSKYSKK